MSELVIDHCVQGMKNVDLLEFNDFDIEKDTHASPENQKEKTEADLKWKLQEGNGECIFCVEGVDGVGLTKENLNNGVEMVRTIASNLNCDTSLVGEVKAKGGTVAHVLIRERRKDRYSDLRFAVCGNVDAGKSTLVGVLTNGHLDNGRGVARASIFTHKHEIETGRTSSIGSQILGFNSTGTCVNYVENARKSLTWGEIIEKSFKVVSFIDLAGHEKYLKTTVSGLTGLMPDYALLLVGANMGVTRMTKEHLGLALALKIPIVIVVTKIDVAPENVRKETLLEINKILKMKGIKKMPVHVRSDEDLLTVVKTIQHDRIVPIFEVSSVTGDNLGILRKFLNLVPPRLQWDLLKANPVEVVIDQTFSVAGVGTIVGGTVIGGTIEDGKTFLLGPDGAGNFRPVTVKSLHSNRVPVKQVAAGRSVGVALKKVKRSEIRRGMVLVDPVPVPFAAWEFVADVVILHHSTSIKKNYEPVIQCMTLRQAARIVDIGEREVLRTGDRSRVRFRFSYRPEYIKPGMRLIFREGRCKGIGIVVSVCNPSGESVGAGVVATAGEGER